MLKKLFKKIFPDREWKVAAYTEQKSFDVSSSFTFKGTIKCRAVILVDKHDRRQVRVVFDEYDYGRDISEYNENLISKILKNSSLELIRSSISTRKLNSYEGFDLCEHHEAFYDLETFKNDFIYGEVDLEGNLIEKSEATETD
ncbi:hypothetical protein Va3_257 [Vibrio phage Va3]|nr:hypothetical protein Va3_257 [Vibrio phage Va3]